MKKKIYKILSIMLAITVVLSCCMISFGAAAGTPVKKIYYLSSKGSDTDDGLTAATAMSSYKGALEKAIAAANAGNYNNAESVVEFKMEATGDYVDWYEEGGISANDLEHKFKVVFSTTGASNNTFLGRTGNSIEFNGPTEFTDSYVDYGRSHRAVMMGILDEVTFGSGMQRREMVAPLMLGTVRNTNTNYTVKKPIVFNLNSDFSFSEIVFGSQFSSVYDESITLNYNTLPTFPTKLDAMTSQPISFGAFTAGWTATYKKNVNINILQHNGITLKKSLGNFTFAQGAGLHIINSSGKALTYDDGIKSDLANAWIITNNTGIKNIIDFTDKAGEFAVDTTKYEVTATPVSGGTAIKAKDGKLVVPAGEYTLSYSVPPQEATYYVSANGSNDNDGSEAKPFKTIGGALTKALAAAKANNYNYPNSTVYLKLLGTDGIAFSDVTGIDYDFTLNISSKTSGGLLDNGAAGTSSFSGPVSFNNISISQYYADSLYFGGDDFSIGKDVKIIHPGGSYPQTIFCTSAASSDAVVTKNDAQDIYYYNSGNAFQYFTIGGGVTTTYNHDFNLIYNASNTSQQIRFDTVNSSATTNFNRNINLHFESAASAELWARSPARVKLGKDVKLQIINSTGNKVTLHNDFKTAFANIPTYYITNNSGVKDVISFTETAGKYKVNVDSSKQVIATLKGGATVEAKNGYLTLTQPGEYDLAIIRDPIYKEYYVSPKGISVTKGTRPATAGTKENPVKTFVDVTYLIEQDGLTKIDVANVYFKAGEKNSWNIEGETDPLKDLVYPINYPCHVIVDSTDPNEKALISNYYSINPYGKTTYKNVTINVEYQYANISLNGHDVVYDENSEVIAPHVYTAEKALGATVEKDQNVVIKGIFNVATIRLGATYYENTFNGDINFYIDNANANATFVLGSFRDTNLPNTYNGDINIQVKKAKTLGISVNDIGATINGAIQILTDNDFTVPYSLTQNFNDIQAAGGKWLITNAATDDDFVDFGDSKGKFTVKGGATAYSRQLNKDMVTHTGGTIDFSAASGAYTVSDKPINPLTDDSRKMLYFSTSGGVHRIVSQTYLVAGETYIYEFGMYCNNFNDIKLLMGHPDSDGAQADFTIISKEKVGDYYKVKAEITVPDEYPKTFAHIGFTMPGYSEGVLFDRVFYRKDDVNKVDQTVENQKFYDGLDGIKLDNSFWGNIFTGNKGGKGITHWVGGTQELKVLNFDEAYIAELIRLANPDDGEWWKENDIVKEEYVPTYAKANGTFKDSDGNPVKNVKMLLVSEEKSYTATTNSKGEFNFGKVLTGYYELYVLDGKKKLDTGFVAFLSENDVLTFNVVSDISELKAEAENSSSDYESVTDGENVEEIEATGNLSGTVYTPYLETVANLKIYLKDIGEVVTDENGNFAFANVPVGEYELYTVLADNSEYSFRKVTIGENQNLAVKLKYEPPVVADGDAADNGWIIWVIIASSVALVVVAGVICLLLFTKKKV
ncbi:MAG: carboxypeptidase regulatory-like domain-containing protein [Clostridia bacterium]|nr:carboxypeptidase regulatory-like domain-containing protein [Clostridia bacterium]